MSARGELPLLRPPALREGDCIGVCAPSGPVDPEMLDRALEHWTAQGYEVTCGAHVRCREGYLSADDADRLADFEGLLDDPRVKAIVLARGGYGVARWLRRLDPAHLRRARKLVVGYSDATLLLLVMQQAARVAAIHGPMLERDDLTASAQARLLAMMRGESAALAPLRGKPSVPGRVSAPLVGGNLTSLVTTIGTPWEVDTTGAILFLEETTEQPYALDRLLVQMREAGKLDAVAGVAVGQLVKCESERYPEVTSVEAVRRVLADSVSGPIVLDLPFGHVADHHALGCGVRAELDGEQGTLKLLEPVVEDAA